MKERPACRKFNTLAFAEIANLKPDKIIVSAHWLNYEKRRELGENDIILRLRETITLLRKLGSQIIVLGPSPYFSVPVPYLMDASASPAAKGYALARHSTVFDAVFKDIEKQRLIRYFPVYSLLCDQKGHCKFRTNGDDPLFWDQGHMTQSGTELVIGKLLQSPLFKSP